MSAPDQWHEIAALTGNLPDGKLLQVLSLIDLLGEGERPQVLVAALRPRLATLKPVRRLTLQRILMMPAEDLLDPPEQYHAGSARLSRRIIRPCWTLINQGFDAQLIKTLTQQVRELRGDDRRGVIAIGACLWTAAATVLRRALERLGADRALAAQTLAGIEPDGLDQLRRCAEVFEIGEAVELTKSHLPARPIETLSESQLETIRDVINRLTERGTGEVGTFLTLMATRMVRPGALLEMMMRLAAGRRTNGLVQEVATRVTANLTTRATALPELIRTSGDVTRATLVARQLMDGFDSIHIALGSRADSVVGDGIKCGRNLVSKFIVNTALPSARDALLALAAPEHTGWPEAEPEPDAGKVLRARDGSGPTVPAGQRQAEDVAMAIRHCAQIAMTISIRHDVEATIQSLAATLAAQSNSTTGTTREQTRRLSCITRLVELIQGPDEAERLLRQGLARIHGADSDDEGGRGGA